MGNRLISRQWLSPVTSATFLVVTVTGVMLASHIRVGNLKGAHEWIGYAFMAAGMLHLLLNRRPLVSYFRTRSAAIAVTACLLVSCSLLLMRAQQRPDPVMQILDVNHNKVIEASELANAAMLIQRLDANNDGQITHEELRRRSVGSK